jgi:hypothetical protein
MSRNRSLWITWAVAGLVVGFLTIGAPVASADTVTYTLASPSPDYPLAGYPAPYGTVEVNLDSSGHNATITVQSLTTGGNEYLMGDGGVVGLNVSSTGWTVGTITGTLTNSSTNTAWSATIDTLGSGNNYDSFTGHLNLKLNSDSGNQSLVQTMSFTLTGGTWASAASVLAPQAAGDIFAAAHFFVCPAAESGCAAGKDYIDPVSSGGLGLDQGYATTPEPDAPVLLWIMLSSSLGIIGLARLFKRRRA